MTVLAPEDSKLELQRLLQLPLSPGAIALLAPYSTDAAVHERFADALRDRRPETRAVAARAIYVIGAPLGAEVERALAVETDPEAAREEIRALALFAPSPDTDSRLREAAARFGGRLDSDLLQALARSRGGDALLFYFASGNSLAIDLESRTRFFVVASRGAADVLISAGTRAIEGSDAPSWNALLFALQQISAKPPPSLLRAALESRVDEIRGETAWTLVKAWNSRAPAQGAELLPALSARPDATAVESEFGVELLARILGRTPAESARWIALVGSEGTAHWLEFLKGSLLFDLLTPGEKDAVKTKHWPDTPKRFPPGSGPTPAKEPTVRGTSSLPTGSLADLLTVSGCRPGSPLALGEAAITYGLDGRPRRVTVLRLPQEKPCEPAARAVFLLSLPPEGHLSLPERPEHVLAVARRDCPATLEEAEVPERGGQPTHARGPVEAPNLQNRVEPQYPESLRKAGLQGTVILQAVVGTDGCVRDLRVLKSAETELAREALFAVSQWRYRPARLNGRPVPVYLTVTVGFNLRR